MRTHRNRRWLAGALVTSAWLLFGVGSSAQAATSWEQGVNYFLIEPPQATMVAPGKIEVTEVFSYACPACNLFYPVADQLRLSLPPNAELDFVPAGFRPDEDWPMFQRAYYAAQVLGIDKRAHDAMFDAVWKSGELAIADPRTNRLKVPPPSIQDAAAFYARVAGIKPEAFVSAANSFGVDTKVRQADQIIKGYRVESTPTIVVNGKYRLDVQSAGGTAQLIELVKWLVAKESGGAQPKSAAH
ncbi:MAG TPA: thiol:disulfide interchange protein DsbA/DsbL [Steroidobacteraceae bacterium]|nr:thiol:disulfide interchange protein DsbA/DsbL [Steroidobacteraceae bacterium]